MLSATLLSTLRMAVGTSLLLAPDLTAKAFFLPILASAVTGTSLISRLAGSRDLVMGAVTLYVVRRARYTAKKTDSSGTMREGRGAEREALLDAENSGSTVKTTSNESWSGNRNGKGGMTFDAPTVQTVLAANLAIDGIDILSSLYCLAGEGLSVEPLALVGGGALLFLGLGSDAMIRMRRIQPG